MLTLLRSLYDADHVWLSVDGWSEDFLFSGLSSWADEDKLLLYAAASGVLGTRPHVCNFDSIRCAHLATLEGGSTDGTAYQAHALCSAILLMVRWSRARCGNGLLLHGSIKAKVRGSCSDVTCDAMADLF